MSQSQAVEQVLIHEVAPGEKAAVGRQAPDKSVMGRGLILLEALSRAGHPLSLADLAKVTRLPKSTVHRMAGQLVGLGLLDKTAAGFGLGLRIFEWGSKAERQRNLRRVAVPHLGDLHTRLGETVHLGVLDGRDVVYIEKIEGHAAVRCPTTVGGRTPAHGTALGKAMLAFTPDVMRRVLTEPLSVQTNRTVVAPGNLQRQLVQVRENRISLEIEESFVGVACVAAPILDDRGVALGAISITVPTFRFNPQKLAPAARQVADRISGELAALDELEGTRALAR
ncbi:MAG: IclR family transcriptional regulator [Nocardioidaceae bacterium]|nr:IclR family transcriptional regulator [Nocardioidaceae bacterium]